MRKTLTYDDVNIVPKYSELESRENVKLNTRFSREFPQLWSDEK